MQSRSPGLRSSGRNVRLWDNPLIGSHESWLRPNCRTPLKNTSVMWISWINMKIIIMIIIRYQRPIRLLPETDYPRASRSVPRIAGSGNEIDNDGNQTKYDFLRSCDISLSFTIFCYLFLLYWSMLIFFCHLGVNSCCYSWYIWHLPYLKSWNINMSTTESSCRTRLAHQELNFTVVINISNFTVVNFYLLGLLFTVYI
jgi:hypothetical protein